MWAYLLIAFYILLALGILIFTYFSILLLSKLISKRGGKRKAVKAFLLSEFIVVALPAIILFGIVSPIRDKGYKNVPEISTEGNTLFIYLENNGAYALEWFCSEDGILTAQKSKSLSGTERFYHKDGFSFQASRPGRVYVTVAHTNGGNPMELHAYEFTVHDDLSMDAKKLEEGTASDELIQEISKKYGIDYEAMIDYYNLHR